MVFRLLRFLLRSRRGLTALALLACTGMSPAQIPPKKLLPAPVHSTVQAQSQSNGVPYPIAIAAPQQLLPAPMTSTYQVQGSPPGANATGLASQPVPPTPDVSGLASQPVSLGPNATGLAGQPEVAPIPAPAGTTKPAATKALTLEECVAIALQRQPSIAAARATLASAETNRAALHKLFLVGLIARDLHIRRQQSDLGVTIASAGLTIAESETIYAVTRCFYGWVYARKQETLVKEVVNELTTNYLPAAQAEAKTKDTLDAKADAAKLELNIQLLKLRQVQAGQGVERALAALREAMGLEACAPLQLVEIPLPEVQEILCKGDIIALALGRRGEIVQADAFAQIVELEVAAQRCILGPTGRTFAAGSDIHSRPVPQGIANKEYRPAALGVEMPTMLVGHLHDRVQRAQELSMRAVAVVEKTRNLIGLEAEDAYLKWSEAAQNLRSLGTPGKKLDFIVDAARKRWDLKPNVEEVIRSYSLREQIEGQVNEHKYHLALALAALERITAGGFIPSFRTPRIHQP